MRDPGVPGRSAHMRVNKGARFASLAQISLGGVKVTARREKELR